MRVYCSNLRYITITYLGGDVGVGVVGVFGENNTEEEEGVNFESVTMGGEAIEQDGKVTFGSPREGIDIREKHGEIGTEALEEVEFGGVRERGVAAEQGVEAIEDVVVLDAEEFFVGEIEGDAFDELFELGGAKGSEVDRVLDAETVVFG